MLARVQGVGRQLEVGEDWRRDEDGVKSRIFQQILVRGCRDRLRVAPADDR